MNNRIPNRGIGLEPNNNSRYKTPQMASEGTRSSPEPRGVSPLNLQPRHPVRVFSDLSEAHSSILSKGTRSDNGSAPASEHSPSPEPMAAQPKTQLGPLPQLTTREKYHLHPNVLFRTPDESPKLVARGRPMADEPNVTLVGDGLQEVSGSSHPKNDQGQAEGYVSRQSRSEHLDTVPKSWNNQPAREMEYDDQVLSEYADGASLQRFKPGPSNRLGHTDMGSASVDNSAESSTVERIISGYGDNEGVVGDEVPSMVPSYYVDRPSPLRLRSNNKSERIADRSAGLPPTQELPLPPQSMVEPQVLKSSSAALDRVLYGGHEQLFSLSRSVENQDVNLGHYTVGREDEPGPNLQVSRQERESREPRRMTDEYALQEEYTEKQKERRPLEREVSKALRRESGPSTNSIDGSSSQEPQGLVKSYKSTLSDVEDLDEISAAPHEMSFYDQSAFSTRFVSDDANGVRVSVPGNQNRYDVSVTQNYSSVPAPEQMPYVEPLRMSRDEDVRDPDNVEDWVTEPERLSGFYDEVNEEGFIGGQFQRTGSSIANRSDDESVHQMIDDFSSTERIAQHPAPLGHSGVYRVRELKGVGGGQQMLLPDESERQYNVNGFLKNSLRGRPRPSPPKSTEPLSLQHKHPFKSTPPQIPKSPVFAWGKGHKRQNAIVDRYNFESSDTNLSDEVDQTPVPIRQIPSVDPLPLDLTGRSLHLTGRFEATPPSAKKGQSPSHLLRAPAEHPESRPNSFQHVYMLAKGERVPGYNADGTLIAEHGFKNDHSPIGRTPIMNPQGFVNVPLDGNGYNSSSPYTPTPKVRPSNKKLYKSPVTDIEMQPLRSVDRYKHNEVEGKPAWGKGTERLNDPYLLDAVDSMFPEQQPLGGRFYGDHSYRRPAPGGGVDQRPASPLEFTRLAGSRPGHQGRRSLMRGFPSLGRRSNVSMTGEQINNRAMKLSILGLIMCNIFPPLLLLFAAGAFDPVINWWTRGDVQEFGKTQKIVAWTLGSIWLSALVAGIVAVLVLYLRN